MAHTETHIREPETKAEKVLTRDEFLARIKPASMPGVVLHVQELGGSVKLRGLTVKEREEVKSGSSDTRLPGKVDDAQFIALTVVKGIVEPKMTPADVAMLIEQGSFGLLQRLSQAIWEQTGVFEAVKKP